MKFPRRLEPVRNRLYVLRNQAGRTVSRYPFVAFLVLLAVLVGLAALGEKLRQPDVVAEVTQTQPQVVSTFEVGGSPSISVQAKIEKSGVVSLVAQTPGVVQKIKTVEGQSVKRGAGLFIFSSTYQGANAPAISRQISQKNYQFVLDTYQTQVDALNRNKEIARVSEAQSSEMREINRKSFDETRSLITLNESMLEYLDSQIKLLGSSNVNGSNDADIFQLQGSKAGVMSALSNLRTSLRTLEYVNSNDQEAAKLSQLSRDATIQQLELQEKTLALNKDISQLQLKLAKISESMMYPASPVDGTVERIHVKVGQSVTPGTVLATIRGHQNSATAVVLLGESMAKGISKYDPSVISLNGQKYEVLPRNISQEPTDGALFSILYTLPDAVSLAVSNNSFIEMSVPLSLNPTVTANGIFVPLDAIYQSQTTASVNVVDVTQNPAVAKNVLITLNKVAGQYVEVTSGLSAGDKVILDRTVMAGDQVVAE